MKNKVLIIIIIFLMILLLLEIITVIYFSKNKKPQKLEIVNKKETEETEEEKYIDDNPFIVGLYTKQGSIYKLLNEYNFDFEIGKDIGVWTFFPTNTEISNGNFNTKWWEYWNSYPNNDIYKIGYNVKFTTIDDNIIDYNILSPEAEEALAGYFYIYLYDDVNIPNGTWHSHVTLNEVNEKTKYTSIKLYSSSLIKDIISPIELTVFTYKSDNDFDLNNKYRGNSSYTIFIKKK